MIQKTSVLLVLFIVLTTTVFVYPQEGGSQNNEQDKLTQKARREKLIAALESENWVVRRRAVLELSADNNFDSDTPKILLKYMLSAFARVENIPQEELIIFDVIMTITQPSSRNAVLPDILKALESRSSEPKIFLYLLLSLGRMGKTAKEAIPYLEKKLGDSKTDAGIKDIIRVVLANIGYESKDNLSAILKAINSEGPTSLAILSTLGFTGSCDWVTSEMTAELTKMLDKPDSDMAAFGAIVLGILGKKASSASEKLAKAQKASMESENYSSAFIIYGFALAKINPEKKEEALDAVFKKLGPYGFGNHTDWPAMFMVAESLIDKDIINQIIQIISKSDAELLPGAMSMLGVIGYRAKDVTPQLLKIISNFNGKQEPESQRKITELAAQTLG